MCFYILSCVGYCASAYPDKDLPSELDDKPSAQQLFSDGSDGDKAHETLKDVGRGTKDSHPTAEHSHDDDSKLSEESHFHDEPLRGEEDEPLPESETDSSSQDHQDPEHETWYSGFKNGTDLYFFIPDSDDFHDLEPGFEVVFVTA